MTATILQFKKPTPSGAEPWLPSLWDMCQVLKENFHRLDEDDKTLYFFIHDININGDNVTINEIISGRAISWSMMGRYGLTV